MNKPNNYDNTKTGGEFTPVELGPHKAVIKEVREMKSRTGWDMIVVFIDFDKTDAQPGYFANAYRNDDRKDKKWPNQATLYILVTGNDGNCTKSFKSFQEAYEGSNNTQIIYGDAYAAQFKDKKIGVNYGEVDEEYNGQVKTRRRIRWCFPVSDFAKQTVPEKKGLTNRPAPAAAGSTDWMNIPDGDGDELPFR